jgi:type IV secretory pathway TraG/TraD family ATPase VirD4
MALPAALFTQAAPYAAWEFWVHLLSGGAVALGAGCERLRWSPVEGCCDFERAVSTAHALAVAARPQAHLADGAHWVERAEALLAPLLFAAALHDAGMAALCRWVLSRDLGEPVRIVGAAGHEMAAAVLEGVAATDERERSGIFSTAAGVLAAYRSDAALESATDPNFSPEQFARSADTVYVCAPGHAQAQLAPIVVALVDAIRAAVYARPADAAPVVFALDEVANIAPLPSLPALAAEGGGQGLVTLACLQDLSQARARWGEQAEGFFSLFSSKVLFPGIGDERTLSLVSALAGERPVAVWTRNLAERRSLSQSWTWRPVLPPDAVSGLAPGTALLVGAGRLAHVSVRAWWEHRVWSALADTDGPGSSPQGVAR